MWELEPQNGNKTVRGVSALEMGGFSPGMVSEVHPSPNPLNTNPDINQNLYLSVSSCL